MTQIRRNTSSAISSATFTVPNRSAPWPSTSDGFPDRSDPLPTTIYEQRAFDRLPILADAVEEAGCDSAEDSAPLSARRGACSRMLASWT